MPVKVKRIYEQPAADDGFRVLVDRLWPRGISKEEAKLDLWLKDIAPSDPLRHWFNHDPAKWPEFQHRYQAELANNSQATTQLRKVIEAHPTITLLYAAHDEQRNNAAALLTIFT